MCTSVSVVELFNITLFVLSYLFGTEVTAAATFTHSCNHLRCTEIGAAGRQFLGKNAYRRKVNIDFSSFQFYGSALKKKLKVMPYCVHAVTAVLRRHKRKVVHVHDDVDDDDDDLTEPIQIISIHPVNQTTLWCQYCERNAPACKILVLPILSLPSYTCMSVLYSRRFCVCVFSAVWLFA